jgi:hypothetical protein
MSRFTVEIYGDTDEVEHLDTHRTDTTDIDLIIAEVQPLHPDWQSLNIRFDRD